ncbi:MAG: hypothetical protein IJX63_09435 [Lachnospiraceae bacterium]|nr:hypothetical protein [Lachnospiraceae bacterium]
MLGKLHDYLENCIKYIAILPLLLLTILVTVFQNTISFDIIETSVIERNGVNFLLLVLGTLIALVVVYKLLRWIPETVLFVIFALVYLVGGIYLITHIQMELRYDSGICYWNALNFVEGNYTNLQFGEYFYKNPHQLGLVSYNCLLIKISDDPNFVYYVNLAWILISNFFLWRTAVLAYEHQPRVRKLVILLSFAFMPQFFYLFYAYGQVPGLGCMMISVYLATRAMKKKSVISMVFSCIFMGAACLLRMNYVIGGIALMIVYFLHALQRKKLLWGVAMTGMLFCMLVPRYFVNGYYEKMAETDLSQGMPSVLYVAMGLQENEEPWRAAGWYNNFNDNTYLGTDCDVQASKVIAMESIGERLQTFFSEPGYAVDFFGEKLITTWCEPTYQSIWSGPMISMNCATDEPWLTELYSGGTIFSLFASVMNVLTVMLFGFSLVFVVWRTFCRKLPLYSLELFSVLFFLGGFLFHIAWETKSQYVYPYVVLLVPIAAKGISAIFEGMKKFLNMKGISKNGTKNG